MPGTLVDEGEAMHVTCIASPVAYVDEEHPHDHGALNLVPEVELVPIHEGRAIPGGDGAPIMVDAGCGRGFEIPYEPWAWDVNTVVADGVERVVERHLAPTCPACGRIADHFSEIVAEPFEFLHQGLSRRHRLALSDPEMARWLGEIPAGVDMAELLRGPCPADRELRRWWTLFHGIAGGSGGSYVHVTEGAVALAGSTVKTVIGAKAGSAVGLIWSYFWPSFDGVSAAGVPVLIELGYCTFGANSPGTNSTGTTERQEYGRVITADWTGGRNWTAEPTTITVIGEGLLSPNGGFILYDSPLGTEPDCAVSEGFVVRMNAPAAVNVRCTQKVRHS